MLNIYLRAVIRMIFCPCWARACWAEWGWLRRQWRSCRRMG